MATANKQIIRLLVREPATGLISVIDTDSAPPGPEGDVIRLIPSRKQEPQFLLDWHLKACRHGLTLPVLQSSSGPHPPIDDNAIGCYSSPASRKEAKTYM